jgi:hypothetical protein
MCQARKGNKENDRGLHCVMKLMLSEEIERQWRVVLKCAGRGSWGYLYLYPSACDSMYSIWSS